LIFLTEIGTPVTLVLENIFASFGFPAPFWSFCFRTNHFALAGSLRVALRFGSNLQCKCWLGVLTLQISLLRGGFGPLSHTVWTMTNQRCDQNMTEQLKQYRALSHAGYWQTAEQFNYMRVLLLLSVPNDTLKSKHD